MLPIVVQLAMTSAHLPPLTVFIDHADDKDTGSRNHREPDKNKRHQRHVLHVGVGKQQAEDAGAKHGGQKVVAHNRRRTREDIFLRNTIPLTVRLV